MPLHSSLTGADLHEPKGIETATAGSVYTASGGGTGVWQKLPAANSLVADPNNVFAGSTVEDVLYELYQTDFLVEGNISNLSTPEKTLLPIPFTCDILSLKMILADPISGSDAIITVTRSDGAAMGSQTITAAGSAEGSSFILMPTGNAHFIGGSHNYIKCVSNGLTTGAAKLFIQAQIRRA